MGDDKTCENCYRVLTGLNIGSRKFCNFNCYTHHTHLIDEIKKSNKLVERERNKWKHNTIDMYRMFYEIMWSYRRCDICRNLFEDQIHLKIKPGIKLQDINEDSFQILCSECYLKIHKLKNS